MRTRGQNWYSIGGCGPARGPQGVSYGNTKRSLTSPAPPGQGGFSLIEMLVAVSILALVGVGFMAALGSGFQTKGITQERLIAENLARAAMEEIRSQPYQISDSPSPYLPLTVPNVPNDYAITVTTVNFCVSAGDPACTTDDDEIQKNTVTILRGGKAVLFLEDLKTRI